MNINGITYFRNNLIKRDLLNKQLYKNHFQIPVLKRITVTLNVPDGGLREAASQGLAVALMSGSSEINRIKTHVTLRKINRKLSVRSIIKMRGKLAHEMLSYLTYELKSKKQSVTVSCKNGVTNSITINVTSRGLLRFETFEFNRQFFSNYLSNLSLNMIYHKKLSCFEQKFFAII